MLPFVSLALGLTHQADPRAMLAELPPKTMKEAVGEIMDQKIVISKDVSLHQLVEKYPFVLHMSKTRWGLGYKINY